MRLRRISVALALACAALLALAAPASAHVTVSAPGATRGGTDVLLTFRVPTESDAAATTGLKVQLPIDTPLASVLVRPMPGWTHTEKTAKLATPITTDDGEITEAVSEIDWTAEAGQGIKPGEFGEFTVLAGRLPDAARLTFKVVQVYGDGSTANWTDVAAPGSSAEPEHPAPVLTLAPAAGPVAEPATGSSQTGAVVLGIVALVVALAAAGLGVLALRRRPDRAAD